MADVNRLGPEQSEGICIGLALATASGCNRRGAAFLALECFCGAGLASKRIAAYRLRIHCQPDAHCASIERSLRSRCVARHTLEQAS